MQSYFNSNPSKFNNFLSTFYMLKIQTLCVNSRYKIYSDGRIFSLLRQKFLNPTPHKGGGQVTIRNFETGQNENFLVNRLKSFHFDDHKFTKYSDMSYVNTKHFNHA